MGKPFEVDLECGTGPLILPEPAEVVIAITVDPLGARVDRR